MLYSSQLQRFYKREYATRDIKKSMREDKNLKEFKGIVKSENPNDTWEDIYHRNLVKLALMILLYVYSNDDEKISNEELKNIKRVNKEEKRYLTNDDHMEIYNLAVKKMTLSAFLEYIRQQEYKESIFNDACDRAKKSMIKNRVYDKILADLKEEFKRYSK
ncbi:hypothetical protein [Mariniplasma anaerobium]|uniref:Uncharacterized protein n=1 Tax=Mariniplasma anaerobium TaxID=2735436 RepID=A0A7U9TIB5_9MOLU|nr:hypothetical protein [Mariniplasma anaerobium]BCR36634.1 hypothetical protein MPAN_015270 [Mariniplasma anaerobium]